MRRPVPVVLAAGVALSGGCGGRKQAAPPAPTPRPAGGLTVVFAARKPGAPPPTWAPDPALLRRLGPPVRLTAGGAATPYALRPLRGAAPQEIARSTDAPVFEMRPPDPPPAPLMVVSVRPADPSRRAQAVLVEEMATRRRSLEAGRLTLEKAEVGRSPGGLEWARVRYTAGGTRGALWTTVDAARGRTVVVTLTDPAGDTLPLLEASVLTLRPVPVTGQ